MNELLLSTTWQRRPEEKDEIFLARIEAQKMKWLDLLKNHGQCYMVKFGEGDIRPMWEDSIHRGKLRSQVPSPIGVPLDCPLCQPYDLFDPVLGKYDHRRYLTKVIYPRYPEGFIDKEGVWIKCPCLKKGDERRFSKFIDENTAKVPTPQR